MIPLGSTTRQSRTTADMLQGGSTGINLQGSSPRLQGNSRVVQGSSPGLQVTNNPYSFQGTGQTIRVGGPTGGAPSAAPSGGGAGAGGGFSSGGGYDAAAAQRQAQEAADAAKAGALRGGIKGIINNMMKTYDTLYGDVRNAATSQRQLLDKRFDRETGALTDQFNQELPAIGRAYAGRGAFDSSYRIDSEGRAQKGFENQLGDLGEQRSADASKIGQFVNEQRADFDAQRGGLRAQLGYLDDVDDVGELTQLRNQLDQRLRSLQASRASNMSRDAYLKTVGELAPANDRMSGLQSTLANLIQGEAPGPLKRAVAQQIITSSGLSSDDQRRLLGEVNSQIG